MIGSVNALGLMPVVWPSPCACEPPYHPGNVARCFSIRRMRETKHDKMNSFPVHSLVIHVVMDAFQDCFDSFLHPSLLNGGLNRNATKKQQSEDQFSTTLIQRALQSCAMRERVCIPYKQRTLSKFVTLNENLSLCILKTQRLLFPFPPLTTSFHEIQFLCIHPS